MWLFYIAIYIPSIWQHCRVALSKARVESGRLRENILSGCHSCSLPSLLACLWEASAAETGLPINSPTDLKLFLKNSHLNWASLSAWVLTARVAHLILKAPPFQLIIFFARISQLQAGSWQKLYVCYWCIIEANYLMLKELTPLSDSGEKRMWGRWP